MKRRFTLATVIALSAITLLGPSSVAGKNGFRITILSDSCQAGDLYFRARAIAGGTTTANELEVDTKIQRLKNGHWRDLSGSFVYGYKSKEFTADGTAHGLTVRFPAQVDPGQTYRLVYSFAAYETVADVVAQLWEQTAISRPCSAPA
jgi:hypothetical protein